jgi:hypothetical protein
MVWTDDEFVACSFVFNQRRSGIIATLLQAFEVVVSRQPRAASDGR